MSALLRYALGVAMLGLAASAQTVEEPTGDLTLAQAVALTLERNPQLATYPWEVRAAEAKQLQASLRPNPELAFEAEDIQIGYSGAESTKTFSIGTDGTLNAARESGSGGPRGFREAQFTLTLSQLIELGGKRAARVAAAAKEKPVAELGYEVARAKTLADMARAFTEVVADQERLTLREQLRDVANQVQQATRARVESGKVSPLELNRAQAKSIQAQIDLDKTSQALRSAGIKLAAYWGSTEPKFTRVAGTFTNPAPPPLPEDIEARINGVPEVRRWMAEIERRGAEVANQKAQAAPDVTASLGWRVQGTADRTASGWNAGAEGVSWTHAAAEPDHDYDHRLVAGFSVPLPLFNRNQGNIAEARARLAQAESELAASRIDARSRLSLLNQNLLGLYREIKAIQEQVLANVIETFDKIQEGYRQGKFGLLDVLDAQESLFDTRIELLQSMQNYQENLTEMELLLGQPLSDLPSPTNDNEGN